MAKYYEPSPERDEEAERIANLHGNRHIVFSQDPEYVEMDEERRQKMIDAIQSVMPKAEVVSVEDTLFPDTDESDNFPDL
ncbi:MAG TPA: hypothetical protein VF572_06305 [Candidatus Saccharimonadales bacterium]|jgi:hypothetical protein